MNRKDDYDSYEIEEPSDEEGAASRYITMISYVHTCKQTYVNFNWIIYRPICVSKVHWY